MQVFLPHLSLKKSNRFHYPAPSLFVFATVFIGVTMDQASGIGLEVRTL